MTKQNDNSQSRIYNCIYEKLVTEHNDLVGIVAYSLYKEKKIEFFKHKKENGEDISEQTICDFHKTSIIHLDSYRNEALRVIEKVTNTIIEKEMELSSDRITDIVDKTAGTKGLRNWIRVIFQNVLGSFVYSVFIIVSLIVIWFISSGTKTEVAGKIERNTKEFLNIQNDINMTDSIVIEK